jgi:hemerythrin superfamily protein
MAVTRKTKAKRSATRKTTRASKMEKSAGASMSAIELLKQDHREVEGFFEEFDELKDNGSKAKLAQKICMALKVHTQVEEELFYPAARKATGDNDMLDEAAVEHAGAKKLIAEIEGGKPGADMFDAKVKVLGEQIHHHVEEEEGELFPEVEQAGIDLVALGEKMAERKSALMANMGPANSAAMRKAG